MTRLKEFRLHGFKSFAEPTRFVFQPGVTAVIGPNGSGKSNMADAIRWVLGEQSNRWLRTRRADDVIFAGSESRRPIGMAEATLTFDNNDGWLPIEFAEVMITRRAYRSGDAEYLINGGRVRLRDVVELLAAGRLGANELVVVGQGTVDAALSLRPDERRQLFEEAAGVKSLQVRRNEALSRLGRAGDNLARVSDLVRELRPQVRRLALQAEHQEAHDRLGSRLRDLVLEQHRRRGRALQSSLGEARRRAAGVAAELAAERAMQARGRRDIDEAEERYWERERAAREAAVAWEAAREAVIRAEGRHDALGERARELSDSLAETEQERAPRAAVEAGVAGVPMVADDDRPRTDAGAAESRWRAAADLARAADRDVLDAEEAVAAYRGRKADRLAALGRQAELNAAGRARRETLGRDLEAVESDLLKARAVEDAAGEASRRALRDLELAEQRGTAVLAERDLAQAEAARASVALAELEERAARVAAEQSELGASDGHATVTQLAERLRARGWEAVAERLSDVPADVMPALDAVLGDLDRVFLLRQGAAGVLADTAGEARLLRPADGPLTGRKAALAAVGGTQTLADSLGDPAAPELLQRTVVAPGVEALLEGWPRLPVGWAAVTMAGDLADARGVVTLRGRAGIAPTETRSTRRAALVARAQHLEKELHEAGARRADTQRALEQAAAAADAAVAAVGAARISRRAAEEDAAADAVAVTRLSERRDGLATQLAAVPEPEPVTGAVAPRDWQDEIARLEAVALVARERRDAAAAERDSARDAWEAAVRAADAEDAAAADRRSAEARSDEQRQQLDARIARLAVELQTLDASRAAAAAALEAARAEETAATATRTRADEDRETERLALLQAERRLSGAAGRLAELEQAQQQVVADVSRLEEAVAGLHREQELSLEGLPEPMAAGISADEPDGSGLADEALAEELRQARRTLQQIGSVNPFAIEEHAELSARLEELTAQESDLRSAAESTETLIDRLDGEISQQFQAAFAAIGLRFDEYCRLLFAGGSASLELTNAAESEAPGGIEIAVRPPGKRLQRLAMLSGGERALAGVALLFAMLSVNPVPFCVLDEVDAALDEANIGRFAEALRQLAEHIDFVVITHNRATIETADTIYGVTMTDAAVSRVLSLRLADLPVEVSA